MFRERLLQPAKVRTMNPADIFWSDCPVDLLPAIAHGLVRSYDDADVITSSWFANPETRHDAIPWVRRSKIEDMLQEAAKSCNEPIEVKFVRTGPWSHTEIRFGRILLTQSRTDENDSLVRPAVWKNNLATQTQQFLFPDMCPQKDHDRKDLIYATLLHGRAKSFGVPGFATIRFPKTNKDGEISGYYEGCIDLKEHFHALFCAPPVEIECIEDSAFPTLRANDSRQSEAS